MLCFLSLVPQSLPLWIDFFEELGFKDFLGELDYWGLSALHLGNSKVIITSLVLLGNPTWKQTTLTKL